MSTRRSSFWVGVTLLLMGAVVVPALASQTLVPAGSIWRYLDNGTDPGPRWRLPDYDDSRWAIGPAQLGYGDGDETTVVSFGPESWNKFITTYFRHSWVETNVAGYSNLILRLLCDDGAVVYLNGMEVARAGLPPGAISPSTRASEAAIEGQLFVSSMLTPGLLRNGTNLLAVEVHQVSAASSDMSFDLELADEPLEVTSILDLAGLGAVFAAPAKLSLTTKVVGLKGLTRIELMVDGAKRDEKSLFNKLYASLDCSFPAPTNCSLALVTYDKNRTARTSVVDVVVENSPSPEQQLSLVSAGAEWRFVDDGADLGGAWRLPGYDDQSWSYGRAALGYGQARVVTPTRANVVTTYFRHHLDVPAPSRFSKLALRVLCDAGVKVYLNGTRVFQNHLPSEPVTARTKALESAAQPDFVSSSVVDPSLLLAGLNVVAVEVHQTAGFPTALVFDLDLTGITPPLPRLSLRFAPPGQALISWPYPSSGFRLLEAPALGQATWTEVGVPPTRVADRCEVVLPAWSGQGFYQLRSELLSGTWFYRAEGAPGDVIVTGTLTFTTSATPLSGLWVFRPEHTPHQSSHWVGQGSFNRGEISGSQVCVDLTTMVDNSFRLIGEVVRDAMTGQWHWDGEGPSASGRFSAWRIQPP